MDDKQPEAERLEQIRMLKAAAPAGIDVERLLAGSLAGPVDEDRPAVPVWEYLDYVATHPEMTIEDGISIRFPIRLHDGELMVTSISELIHVHGPGTPTYRIGPPEVVHLYQLQHEFGAVIWNSADRTHEEAMPLSAYQQPVYDVWRSTLPPWTDNLISST